MVVDEVVHCAGLRAGLRPVGHLDLHLVLGVVEVNDVDVEDQHRRRRDVLTSSLLSVG